MPAEGPSKEQLEYYFKNSRQYFDELAKQFYETDREYYDKFIAPFYSPFGSMTPGSKPRSRAAISFTIAALLALIAGGFSVYLMLQRPEDTNYEQKKMIENTKENTKENAKSKPDERVKPPEMQTQSNKLSNYEKGLRFYNQKDYDAAERYFNKVSKDDDNYDDAQYKLEQIKKLREENKSGNENKRDRYIKPRPVERIR
jgi:hypothetical protein